MFSSFSVMTVDQFQIVLHRKKEVLDCECEMPFVHSLLSKMPDDLPFEQLISHAGDLFVQYPPKALAKEAEEHYQMQVYSVLHSLVWPGKCILYNNTAASIENAAIGSRLSVDI